MLILKITLSLVLLSANYFLFTAVKSKLVKLRIITLLGLMVALVILFLIAKQLTQEDKITTAYFALAIIMSLLAGVMDYVLKPFQWFMKGTLNKIHLDPDNFFLAFIVMIYISFTIFQMFMIWAGFRP